MYRIGVDLGGTNIAAAIIDQNHEIIKKSKVPTNASRPANEIMDDMAELCFELCRMADISIDQIKAVGIASPGVVNSKEGVVEYSCNLPFRKFPICKELSSRINISNVHAENDANAAAWGEAIAGVAKGTQNSVMITLGTGVGSGVIIDGKVYSGANYAGAEIGHVVIEKGGVQCSCGRRGCWETYSSASAVIRMTKEEMARCAENGIKTALTDHSDKYGKVSGRTAFDAMRANDPQGKKVVDEYVSYLACGLVNVINIFQPEIISIGGGVSGEGDALVDMLNLAMKNEQYGSGTINPIKISIAKLGNDAGIIGAAFLGI